MIEITLTSGSFELDFSRIDFVRIYVIRIDFL